MASPSDDDALDLLGSDSGGTTPHPSTGLSIERPFPRNGGAADWAASITVVLAAAIILVALVTVVLERRRPRAPALGFLRLLGLGALPLFLLPIGNFATFEGSKSVEFCHSCHSAMDPYVTDMWDPESPTLAAIHYRNRYIPQDECFQCHADYGIFGAAKAKANGLNHLYYWVTDSPTARGERQIRHYGPYRNELCLNCHAGSRRFLDAKDGVHRDMPDELVTKNARTGAPVRSCLECHKPAHRSLEEWKARRASAR
jgi:nitrate/TMAO reductase-like tetraheme cytochrome c subunit